MRDRILVYGAYGYTGRMIVRELLARGLSPVVGGRSRAKLEALARPDALRYHVAALHDGEAVAAMLANVALVVNAAGPFHATAVPLARACIARGVQYLDICGELSVFEALATLDEDARRARVMLLPGIGFDVTVTDCAARKLASRLPSARHLVFGLTGLDGISRGSAATVADYFAQPVIIRRAGALEQVPVGALTRDFDFGHGVRRATAIAWADVSSAYRSTRIENITFYYDLTPLVQLGVSAQRGAPWLLGLPGMRLLQGTLLRVLPEGPSHAARTRGRATCVVEVSDDEGRRCGLRVSTPEVYSLSAQSAAAIADRVLQGEHAAGFQTPALVFSPDFGLTLPGVRVTELDG